MGQTGSARLNCLKSVQRIYSHRQALSSGLKVVSTDAGSTRDFQAFAKQTGNELVEQQTAGKDFIHVLKRR